MNEYKKAQKRVKDLKEFYEHLAAYVIVLSFFAIGASFLGTPGVWVVGIIAWGWGMGLAFHAWEVYSQRWLDEDWEAEQVARLLGEAPRKRKNDEAEDFYVDVEPLSNAQEGSGR